MKDFTNEEDITWGNDISIDELSIDMLILNHGQTNVALCNDRGMYEKLIDKAIEEDYLLIDALLTNELDKTNGFPCTELSVHAADDCTVLIIAIDAENNSERMHSVVDYWLEKAGMKAAA